MTNAGWYPDPAGTPHTYRYWDGQAWSQATSTAPFGQGQAQPPAPTPPPMVPPAPPTSQPYGALPDTPQQWSPMPGAPTPAQPGGSHAGRTIAIVTGAVAFLVLLAIIAFVAVRTLGGGGDAPSARPPAASDTPTSDPTDPGVPGTAPAAPLGTVTTTAAQCDGVSPQVGGSPRAGRVVGGGLSAPALADHGYSADRVDAGTLTFASGVTMVSKVVSSGWMSMMAVGSLPKSNGFTSPAQAARVVVACMASDPSMYSGAYAVPEVSADDTTVDGHRAFSLVQEIKVRDPSTTATGDTVQVVVVDTGNPKSYGVFLMGVPIGNSSYLALEKSTAGQLRVE